jgi:hypothetical protein
MAAGLGFKDFVTGEVLTAADVDGYLMQGVWVFASAAARDAAVTSPQEGNFAYLKDTNVTTYYTGSAWANLDTTGMTNPMTTTGDTIYSSSGSTPARLGIGTTGQILTVAGGVPSWATPAGGGGMTLINTGGTTLTGSSVTIGSIPSTYKSLVLKIYEYSGTVDGTTIRIRFNSDANTRYVSINSNSAPGNFSFGGPTSGDLGANQDDVTTSTYFANVEIPNYSSTATWKMANVTAIGNWFLTPSDVGYSNCMIVYNQTTAISSIDLFPNSGNFDSGTAYLYGVS